MFNNSLQTLQGSFLNYLRFFWPYLKAPSKNALFRPTLVPIPQKSVFVVKIASVLLFTHRKMYSASSLNRGKIDLRSILTKIYEVFFYFFL